MVYLLVRNVNNGDKSGSRKDLLARKRGHVTAVLEEGHTFGTVELTGQQWRILHCPEMTMTEAEGFVARDETDRKIKPMARTRLKRVRFADLPPAIRAKMNAATRTEEITRVSLAQLRGARKNVPEELDPERPGGPHDPRRPRGGDRG